MICRVCFRAWHDHGLGGNCLAPPITERARAWRHAHIRRVHDDARAKHVATEGTKGPRKRAGSRQ